MFKSENNEKNQNGVVRIVVVGGSRRWWENAYQKNKTKKSMYYKVRGKLYLEEWDSTKSISSGIVHHENLHILVWQKCTRKKKCEKNPVTSI